MATRSSLSDVESLASFAQLWNYDLVFDNLPTGVSGSLREMTFRCRSATLPSQEVEDMLIELHGVSINRAGRATKEDVIDLAVGLVLHKKVGDKVEEGESILTIYSNRENVEDVKQKLYDNIFIADTATAPTLIHTVITE